MVHSTKAISDKIILYKTDSMPGALYQAIIEQNRFVLGEEGLYLKEPISGFKAGTSPFLQVSNEGMTRKGGLYVEMRSRNKRQKGTSEADFAETLREAYEHSILIKYNIFPNDKEDKKSFQRRMRDKVLEATQDDITALFPLEC